MVKKNRFDTTVLICYGDRNCTELRFVLLEMNGVQSILASTSLTLDPLSIIRLIVIVFGLECTFPGTETQRLVILLSFLVKAHAKTEFYRKKEEPSPGMCGRKSAKKILEAVAQ